MTKLKTLKDFTTGGLEFREKRTSEKLIEDLKSEAIKWVKDINSKMPKELNFESHIVTWIKHFFNITEADLQEKK
jgi:hypothetical protein